MRCPHFTMLSATLAASLGGLGLSPLGAQTNEPPRALAIPGVVIEVGASRDIHLAGHFVDPDGDELGYTAAVFGPSSVVAAEMSGGLLTLVAISVGRAEVQVTAFDPGGLSATLILSVTVAISGADRARTLDRTLSVFGRAIGTEAVEVIAQRLEAGGDWGGGAPSLPSSPSGHPTLPARAAGSFAELAHGGLTLWARIGSGGFGGTPEEDFDLDGSSQTAFVGGDYRRADGVALGLAGSHSSAPIDFESGVNGRGTVKARITGVHPYLKWSLGAIDAWAAAGFGWGEADLEDHGGVLAADLRLTMGAGGVRKSLSKFLSIRADAFQTTISTPEAEGIDALDAVSQRVRIAPRLSARINGGSTALSANVEVGVRVDGGDAETGFGAGAAGDLALTYVPVGLTLGARGRTVVAHQDSELADWGVGFEVSVRPGRRSSGLLFSVAPAWGEASYEIRHLWTGAAARPATTKAVGHRLHPDQLRVELGYALPTGVVRLVGERAFDPDGTPPTRLVLEGSFGL